MKLVVFNLELNNKYGDIFLFWAPVPLFLCVNTTRQ